MVPGMLTGDPGRVVMRYKRELVVSICVLRSQPRKTVWTYRMFVCTIFIITSMGIKVNRENGRRDKIFAQFK